MEINQVYKENCIAGMQQMDAESVDLCVTSPPYDDLRTYNDSSKWDFEVFKQVAQELYRVVKVGGVVVWVVGDAVVKGGESMSSFRQALYFGELGFLLHDTMIYEKNGSAFPARKDSNRYSQIFEYMFVFSKKTKPKTANLIADKPNKWAGHTNWGKGTYRDKDQLLHILPVIISGATTMAKDLQQGITMPSSILQCTLRHLPQITFSLGVKKEIWCSILLWEQALLPQWQWKVIGTSSVLRLMRSITRLLCEELSSVWHDCQFENCPLRTDSAPFCPIILR
jgi:hypothetical protein